MVPVPGQKLWQELFVDGYAPFAKIPHLGFVTIDTFDQMSHLCKADGRHKAHMT